MQLGSDLPTTISYSTGVAGTGGDPVWVRHADVPREDFLRAVMTIWVGEKNGQGWSPCIFGGDGRRLKVNAMAISCLVLDNDTGMRRSALVGRLRELGLCGAVVSSSSHGSTETIVKDKKILEDPEIDIVAYYRDVKGYSAEVFSDEAVCVNIPPDEDGRPQARIVHVPLSKHRIIIPLTTPFIFPPLGTKAHTDRLDEWTEIYTRFTKKFGGKFDMSCAHAAAQFLFSRKRFDSTADGADECSTHASEWVGPVVTR
jgi:hypothetical protein